MILCPPAFRPMPVVARCLLALGWLMLALTMLPAEGRAHSAAHQAMPVASEVAGHADADHGSVGGVCCGSAVFCTILAIPGRQETGIRLPLATPAVRIPTDDADRASLSPERDPPVPRRRS